MEKKLKIGSTINCDVLIIGAGGAGLRCASRIYDLKPETSIIAATKVPHPQKSHTGAAQGGLSAVDPNDPVDKIEYHMFDTWKGSDCTADQNVIKKIIEASWDEIMWLVKKGMHFTRNEEGKLSKRTFGGHTIRFGESSAFRAIFESDRTGKGILDAMWTEALKNKTMFLNQSIATELLIKDGRCVGALLFRQKQGDFVKVSARATILATGGSGQVFRITTNCRHNTGDGLAVAMQAGLPVMDLEAVQFHPTGIVGPGILASEALRGEGGILRNKDLEPFMINYAPKMKDLAPRDVVSRAIETEIRENRGILNPDHNIPHIWIDLRHLSDYVHDVKLREISTFFKTFANINPKKELCPVRPSNHYHMGGIPTTEFGEVQQNADKIIPGLFAVGECAGASFHGFNRLATNSILELITMGRFVGERVADYLKENSSYDLPKNAGEKTLTQFNDYLNARGEDNLGQIKEKMRNTMTEKAGVFRTEKGLTEAMATLKELKNRVDNTALSSKTIRMNQELVQCWELNNLLSIALVIVKGAIERRESRGAHYREDYQERKDEFNYHTMSYMTKFGEITLDKKPINRCIYEAGGENCEKFGNILRKY